MLTTVLAAAKVDEGWLFALAVVALILSIITLVQSRIGNILAWAVVAASLALVLLWWPD